MLQKPRTNSMHKVIDIAKDSIEQYGSKKTIIELPTQFKDILQTEKHKIGSPFYGLPFNKLVTIAIYCFYFSELKNKDILEVLCRENDIKDMGISDE